MNNFELTQEDLEKSEIRKPIFSIYHTLTQEQLEQVDINNEIKASLLTEEQLKEVNEALAFDYHFSEIGQKVSESVHRCL